MDIRTWLRGLGLERYEEAFRENEIDSRSLPHLTGEDLKELGVTAIGHRRLLLQAIADLVGPVVASPPLTAPRREAERRQLTVLFCDLVGSTAISASLDPEDMREVIAAYQTACAEVVRRFDGHVAKFMGDGILAYFGYPRAHEDDAERAVRASLELIEAVGRLSPPGAERLKTRVGIDTGLVVVGDLIGEGAAQEEAVIGDTPNRAARLQALAEPDAVLTSENTRLLLGATFTYADLGARQIKGFAEPLGVWRVTGLSAAESRFDARAAAGLTPFIGRDEEIALLLQRWQQAKDGEGQVLLLCGEPGIGKSRITQVLRERLGREPHTRLRYQCSPYHTSSALHPVIEQLERAAGFERDDTVDAKLAKLEDLVGTEGNVPALFASMLSLEAGDRYSALNMSPQKQKEETLQALADQGAALSEQQPVLMIFEDAHWIDPTSQEMLDLMVPQIADMRVLMVVTYRPEYEAPWSQGLAHLTNLSLNRLGRKQASGMVARITRGRSLPDEVLDLIVAKTDGVPLFVEELTKTVIDSGIVTETEDAYELTGPLTDLAIPSTIQDSLMARLDRLALVKEVAQIGACIGRKFPYDVLAAVSQLGENALNDALAQLVGAELIFVRGTPPDASYLFKHALVQDVAYDSLLKSRRVQLHSALADVLVERVPGVAETAPETIAHHLTEAGRVALAIDYWERAGVLASRRSSNVEAIAHLEAALSLVPRLPEDASPAEQEMRLLNILAAPLMSTKGYAALETGKVYERILALCETAGSSEHLYQALSGVSQYHMVAGDSITALKMAEDTLARAEREKQADGVLEAHRLVGVFSWSSGQFRRSVRHFDIVRELFDPDRRTKLALLFGQDHEMSSYIMQSLPLAAMGYLDRSRANVDAGIAASLGTNHVYSQAYALAVSFVTFNYMRDINHTEAVEKTIALCTEHSISYNLAIVMTAKGYAMTRRGEIDSGITQMKDGIALFEECGAGLFLPHYKTLLAEAFIARGDLGDATELLDQAAEPYERWGEGHYRAESIRVRGDLLRCAGDDLAGEACYREAIAFAQEQEASLFELRAATSLARLWKSQAKTKEARDLLAPVYGWFTEGFDAADLKEAKALLDELR